MEFVTRFAVTTPVRTRKASKIAQAFLDHVVFVFGPCRELMLNGAPELQSALFDEIAMLMQVDMTHSVPY